MSDTGTVCMSDGAWYCEGDKMRDDVPNQHGLSVWCEVLGYCGEVGDWEMFVTIRKSVSAEAEVD